MNLIKELSTKLNIDTNKMIRAICDKGFVKNNEVMSEYILDCLLNKELDIDAIRVCDFREMATFNIEKAEKVFYELDDKSKFKLLNHSGGNIFYFVKPKVKGDDEIFKYCSLGKNRTMANLVGLYSSSHDNPFEEKVRFIETYCEFIIKYIDITDFYIHELDDKVREEYLYLIKKRLSIIDKYPISKQKFIILYKKSMQATKLEVGKKFFKDIEKLLAVDNSYLTTKDLIKLKL